ncbi:RHS repeat-associated core domain-containing protein [Spartinivicinus ruber]|uniref:RHS repeat-associated core domain-containing protein n=1 Tax=Spartinivicinus ruber TaxID=2683272 RepID=UPI001CA438B5|nr:RHS repeat-associated core domain-containing protein [Spartinivicinus ruber]
MGSLKLHSGGTAELVAAVDNLKVATGNDSHIVVGNDMQEHINGIKHSLAKLKQITQVKDGGKVWLGNESDNVLQLLSEFMTVVEQLTQDPKAATNRRGFTGHVQDRDLGLVYMQARYYDPVLGRFMAIDPVDVLDYIKKDNPVFGFNRYANNNPYGYIDPDGLEIKIIGSSSVMEDVLKDALNTLRKNSANADRIVKDIEKSKEVVVITDGPVNKYDPDENLLQYNRYFKSKRPDMQIPPEIILGHELIHAKRDLEDDTSFTRFFEERETVGSWPFEGSDTENQIREDYRENGIDVPSRDGY